MFAGLIASQILTPASIACAAASHNQTAAHQCLNPPNRRKGELRFLHPYEVPEARYE
jgi:hypothetical protein